MLIFAALCVGTSLNTTQDDNTDNFDGFEEELNKELNKNYICLLDKDLDKCTNTRFILDKYGFAEILSKSCIWTQILFSFLYWNSDTQESYDTICRQLDAHCTVEDYIPYFKKQISYILSPPSTINTDVKKYLEDQIHDEAVYEGAIKLCETLKDENIIGIENTHDGITFTGKNKNNYGVVVSNGIVKAERTDKTATASSIYIGAYVQSETTSRTIDPIKSEDKMNEASVEQISTDEKAKKINLVTYYLYMLSKEFNALPISTNNEYAKQINSHVKITEYVNKIFGTAGNLDNVSLAFIPNHFRENTRNEHNSNTKKLSLLKHVNKDKFKPGSSSEKPIKMNDAQVDYINNLINTIQQYVDPDDKKTNTKIKNIKDKQADKVIELFDQANISEESYNLFLLSYDGSLDNTKLALDHSLLKSQWLYFYLKGDGKEDITIYGDSVQEYNQMKRIKDGSLSATKMTMMHLVTGQTYKANMVRNTLELCQVLYKSTDLKL
jgi:hypothetical protein